MIAYRDVVDFAGFARVEVAEPIVDADTYVAVAGHGVEEGGEAAGSVGAGSGFPSAAERKDDDGSRTGVVDIGVVVDVEPEGVTVFYGIVVSFFDYSCHIGLRSGVDRKYRADGHHGGRAERSHCKV